MNNSIDWNGNDREKVWTADNIQELGSDFLRLVLSNMQHEPESIVRFDKQISGYQPMYQVTLPQGTRIFFSGSHDESAPDRILHLAEPLTYQQIDAAYVALEDEHKT